MVRIVPHRDVFLMCLMQEVSSTSSDSAILISSSKSRGLLCLLACIVPMRNLSSYLSSFVHNVFFLWMFFRFSLITCFEQLDYDVFCVVFLSFIPFLMLKICWTLCISEFIVFMKFRKFLAINSSYIFFCSPSFLLSSQLHIHLGYLKLPYRSQIFFFFSKILFSISFWIISTAMFSRSLIFFLQCLIWY